MAAQAEPSRRDRHRVLVVEDYEDTAQSMATLLKLYGFDVSIAGDGERAIVAACEYQPDAILLDLGLPRVDGFQVASTLRKDPSYKDTLIIAISGYGQAEDQQRSRAAGIDYQFLKPVDCGVLIELLSWPGLQSGLAS
jgi:CheY-like chemotaxis protein